MTRLEGCLTTVEKKMVAEGAFLQVRETRTMFQDWMRPRFTEIVEDATGRRAAAFFSQVTHDPDIAVELFLLDRVGSSTVAKPTWLPSEDAIGWRQRRSGSGRGRNVGLESCASTLRLCSGLAPASVNQSVRSSDPRFNETALRPPNRRPLPLGLR